MIPYQKMYSILCGAASDAIDALPVTPDTERARNILLEALRAAEELYLSCAESDDPA